MKIDPLFSFYFNFLWFIYDFIVVFPSIDSKSNLPSNMKSLISDMYILFSRSPTLLSIISSNFLTLDPTDYNKPNIYSGDIAIFNDLEI